MVERRKGGETGVEWLQAYRGDSFWKAHEEGVWSPALFKTALCRSETLRCDREGFTGTYPTLQEMKALARNPVAYHYRYKDGLRSTIMLMNGLVEDFNFAASIEGQAKPFSTMCIEYNDGTRATLLMLQGADNDFTFSARVARHGLIATQFFRSPVPNVAYSANLTAKIEQMFMTGSPPYPVRRTLLTGGILEGGLTSRARFNRRLETPQLTVRYQPSSESQYART